MKTFQSKRWGCIEVRTSTYPNKALAIVLMSKDEGDFMLKLSTNLGGVSEGLPERCFYAKEGMENEELAAEALASGLFKVREDIPVVNSGYNGYRAWELL